MSEPGRFLPGQLWSLWDMLTLFEPGVIDAAVNLSLVADRLFRVHHEMEDHFGLQPSILEAAEISIGIVERFSIEMRFAASKAACARFRAAIADRRPDNIWSKNGINALAHCSSQLAQSFRDELQAKPIFSMNENAAELLNAKSEHFGPEVADKFPLSAEDIEEASSCLAFGRYTATVFHLMRAMEAAVKVLASKVGTQNVEKEWGKLLSDIGSEIEKMPKGAERDRWSESHSHLYHVKQAWRNDTMHPKKTYTDSEAEAVYRAVKSFMTHLAPLV